MIENGNRAAGKAALREERGALHEQDDVLVAHDVGNAVFAFGVQFGHVSHPRVSV